jgi:uncharacterized protein YcbK (DUF882 family)
MHWNRRGVLQAGAVLASAAASTAVAGWALAREAYKHLELEVWHTGESLAVEFSRSGAYIPAALAQIQTLLRDVRSGADHPIDGGLLDTLHELAACWRVPPKFVVLSGYRAPRVQDVSLGATRAVQERSLHTEGRAIDVRLARIDSRDLAASALTLARGGVGYYRAADFVHLDTGAVRSWRG